MEKTTQLAKDVYRLASGSTKTPATFIEWFMVNESKFNLTDEDFTNISRPTLNLICDLAEEAGFNF